MTEKDNEAEKHHDNMASNRVKDPSGCGVYYNLVVLAASFVANFCIIISFIGFGVLYITFSEVFQQPKAVIGWIGSLLLFSHRSICLVASVFIDRYGGRPVFIVGALMVGLGCATSAFAVNILMMYITYGVLIGAGSGMCILSLMVTIPTYFKTRKKLAIGLIGLGFSVGALSTAPIIRGLINYVGWRGAMLMIGGISLQSVVCGALMRPPNYKYKASNNAKSDGRNKNSLKTFCTELWDFSPLKDLRILLFTLGNVLYYFGFNTFLHHLSSRAVAHGINADAAAMMTSMISIGTVSIRLPITFLAQWKRTNVTLMLAISTIIGGVLIITTGLHNSYPYMVAHAIINGSCIGTYYTLQLMVALEIAGQQKLARVQGITLFLGAIVSIFITPAGGWMYDVTGNYDLPFFVMGSIQLLGGLLFLSISFQKGHRQTDGHSHENNIELDIKTQTIKNNKL